MEEVEGYWNSITQKDRKTKEWTFLVFTVYFLNACPRACATGSVELISKSIAIPACGRQAKPRYILVKKGEDEEGIPLVRRPRMSRFLPKLARRRCEMASMKVTMVGFEMSSRV